MGGNAREENEWVIPSGTFSKVAGNENVSFNLSNAPDLISLYISSPKL